MSYHVPPNQADARSAAPVHDGMRGHAGSPATLEWARRCADGVRRFVRGPTPYSDVGSIASVNAEHDPRGGVKTASADPIRDVAHDAPSCRVVPTVPDDRAARGAYRREPDSDIAAVCRDGRSLPRTLRTLIERDAVTGDLSQNPDQAQYTLNSIGDAVVSTDVDGRVTYLNAVAEGLTGWSHAEAVGRPLEDVFRIVEALTRETVENPMARAVLEGRTVGLAPNSVLISRSGVESAIEDSASPIRDGSGSVRGAVMVFRDVSVARAHAQRMEHLVQHDSLTEVANRLLLNDRLTQAVALARREQRQVAVLFVDVDHFKSINDSLGHDIGDQLLRSVAQRLLGCVRTSDTVSRVGGDEFVILLPEVARAQDAALAAETILRAFDRPHGIGPHELQVSLSIGIATFPEDGIDADELVTRADLAMYRAKAGGRNTFAFASGDVVRDTVKRKTLASQVVRAIERRDFALHYQPTICLATRAVTGVEALLRWRHPKLGLVLPRDLIPLAEKQGVFVAIGRWVLRDACRQGQAWQDACLPPMRIAVNVSAAELRGHGFVTNVREVLKVTGLDAQYLELEVTEAALLQNTRSTGDVLRALKEIGVRLALDDFGTGLASLGHLRKSAIDVIKIDRSLVQDVATDESSAGVVGAVIGMAESLRIQVVAEGVETAAQLRFLQDQGCAEAQGFYFSRPVAVDDMTALLWRAQTERVA